RTAPRGRASQGLVTQRGIGRRTLQGPALLAHPLSKDRTQEIDLRQLVRGSSERRPMRLFQFSEECCTSPLDALEQQAAPGSLSDADRKRSYRIPSAEHRLRTPG